jgi:hypothetical protein
MYYEGEVKEQHEPVGGIAVSAVKRLPFCLLILGGSFLTWVLDTIAFLKFLSI